MLGKMIKNKIDTLWRSPPSIGKAEAVEIRATGFGEI
jgi:hypothetical protein